MLQRRTAVVRQRKNPPVGISNTAGSRTTSEIGLVAPLIPVGDGGYCAGFAGCVKILEKKERQPDYAWRKAFSSTPEVRPTEIFGSYEEARLAMSAL